MANQRPAEVRTPLHCDAELRLEILGEQFREHCLFREIFRSDDELRGASSTTGRKAEGAGDKDRRDLLHTTPSLALSRRSIHPNAASASTASNAAGMAPARMTLLLTIVRP